MSDVLRLLRTPRWLALTALAVTVIVAFGVLSRWQWDRAHQDEAAAAAAADPAPVALDSLVADGEVDATAYGRRVQVAGDYLPAAQRIVPRGDEYWVLTPLVTETGTAVAIVRGTVTDPSQAGQPPAGPVEAVGRIEPYDGDPGVQPGDAQLPQGQVPRLTRSVLEPLVAGTVDAADLAGGWVALLEQTPPTDLTPVTSASAPEAGAGLRWQNASYAVQWVLFAGFVGFLWWRWFRDDLQERRASTPAGEPAGTAS